MMRNIDPKIMAISRVGWSPSSTSFFSISITSVRDSANLTDLPLPEQLPLSELYKGSVPCSTSLSVSLIRELKQNLLHPLAIPLLSVQLPVRLCEGCHPTIQSDVDLQLFTGALPLPRPLCKLKAPTIQSDKEELSLCPLPSAN